MYDVGMPKQPATEDQLRLFELPRKRHLLTATEVRLGEHWLPICRAALAEATEVRPS